MERPRGRDASVLSGAMVRALYQGVRAVESDRIDPLAVKALNNYDVSVTETEGVFLFEFDVHVAPGEALEPGGSTSLGRSFVLKVARDGSAVMRCYEK